MTTPIFHPNREAIIAWALDKPVQYRVQRGDGTYTDWADCQPPAEVARGVEYRRKPGSEPTTYYVRNYLYRSYIGREEVVASASVVSRKDKAWQDMCENSAENKTEFITWMGPCQVFVFAPGMSVDKKS